MKSSCLKDGGFLRTAARTRERREDGPETTTQEQVDDEGRLHTVRPELIKQQARGPVFNQIKPWTPSHGPQVWPSPFFLVSSYPTSLLCFMLAFLLSSNTSMPAHSSLKVSADTLFPTWRSSYSHVSFRPLLHVTSPVFSSHPFPYSVVSSCCIFFLVLNLCLNLFWSFIHFIAYHPKWNISSMVAEDKSVWITCSPSMPRIMPSVQEILIEWISWAQFNSSPNPSLLYSSSSVHSTVYDVTFPF